MIKDYYVFENVMKSNIRECGLDIGVIYYIMKNILTDIQKEYESQVRLEAAQEVANKSPNDTDNIENGTEAE